MPNALDKWGRPEYNPLEPALPPGGTQPNAGGELPYFEPPTTQPQNPNPPKPPYPEPVTPMPKPPIRPEYNPLEGPVKPPYPEPEVPMPKPPGTVPTTPGTAPNGNTGIVPPGYQPGQTLADYTANAGTGGVPPAQYGSGQVISDFMDQFTNPNSRYIQNARRSGVEQSNSRGGLNSSIAAGASEREAIKAAQPLVSEASNLLRSREGYAAQNWINSNQFDREFNGSLALLPITNAMSIMQQLTQAATDNPEIFTPEIVSGYSNFFAQNMQDILSNYFGTGG